MVRLFKEVGNQDVQYKADASKAKMRNGIAKNNSADIVEVLVAIQKLRC